jgi:hypothetical protein
MVQCRINVQRIQRRDYKCCFYGVSSAFEHSKAGTVRFKASLSTVISREQHLGARGGSVKHPAAERDDLWACVGPVALAFPGLPHRAATGRKARALRAG